MLHADRHLRFGGLAASVAVLIQGSSLLLWGCGDDEQEGAAVRDRFEAPAGWTEVSEDVWGPPFCSSESCRRYTRNWAFSGLPTAESLVDAMEDAGYTDVRSDGDCAPSPNAVGAFPVCFLRATMSPYDVILSVSERV